MARVLCPALPCRCKLGPRHHWQRAAKPAPNAQALLADSGPGEEEPKQAARSAVWSPVGSAGPPSPHSVTRLCHLCKVANFYLLRINDFYSNELPRVQICIQISARDTLLSPSDSYPHRSTTIIFFDPNSALTQTRVRMYFLYRVSLET